MILLDGKKLKKEILDKIKNEVENLIKKPGLVVIQVGDDSSSTTYVKQKEKMAEIVGFNFKHVLLPLDIQQNELLEIIDVFNQDKNIDGLLVQMPLPVHLDSSVIQNAIDPKIDVDGLTDINAGRLMHNKECLVACTPLGIMKLLEYYDIEIEGKTVVIVGRSNLVGKPLSALMTNRNATVILCHSKTKDLSSYTKQADILVASLGKPNFIKSDHIKDNAVLVDVGFTWIDGSAVGDIDFESVKDKASYLTPVPGGVGQMTVAMLGENVLTSYKDKNDN